MKAAQIRPITYLKSRTRELVEEVRSAGSSVVITQNGKPAVVVMDARQHDRLKDTLTMLKLLAQSQESLAREGTITSAEVRRRAAAAIRRATDRG